LMAATYIRWHWGLNLCVDLAPLAIVTRHSVQSCCSQLANAQHAALFRKSQFRWSVKNLSLQCNSPLFAVLQRPASQHGTQRVSAAVNSNGL
jgi:hypothetical protein